MAARRRKPRTKPAPRRTTTRTPKLTAQRVPLDRAGYVRRGPHKGRFFGAGCRLWRVTDSSGVLDVFVRATSAKAARLDALGSALRALQREAAAIENARK